jgi:hypothetical protein
MEVSSQLHAPAALPLGKEPLVPVELGGWMGPRAVLDAVVKRKIPSPRRESNPRTPIIQPVAQRYTDWAIAALVTYYFCNVCFNSILPSNSHWASQVPRLSWKPKFHYRVHNTLRGLTEFVVTCYVIKSLTQERERVLKCFTLDVENSPNNWTSTAKYL